MKKNLPWVFIIVGALFLPFALIAGISGSSGDPLDGWMRLLFIGVPTGLLFAGNGLLSRKRWAVPLGIAMSIVLTITMATFGILGLPIPGNAIFCAVTFALTVFFAASIIHLIKMLKSENEK